MKADLSFTKSGMFTRFIPNTAAGETAWRELAKNSDGSGAFFTHQTASILSQLRKSGYSVGKVKAEKLTLSDSDLSLLEELSK